MTLRLGELMVRRGLLTEEQVGRILEEQRGDSRPFGEIAERMFGLSPRAVEGAWVEQYASFAPRIDPRLEAHLDKDALAMVHRRQAWQFGLLPIRRDGEGLLVCTTEEHLARAVRFVYRALGVPSYFALSAADALGEALVRHYPIAGMTPACVSTGMLAGLGAGRG